MLFFFCITPNVADTSNIELRGVSEGLNRSMRSNLVERKRKGLYLLGETRRNQGDRLDLKEYSGCHNKMAAKKCKIDFFLAIIFRSCYIFCGNSVVLTSFLLEYNNRVKYSLYKA